MVIFKYRRRLYNRHSVLSGLFTAPSVVGPNNTSDNTLYDPQIVALGIGILCTRSCISVKGYIFASASFRQRPTRLQFDPYLDGWYCTTVRLRCSRYATVVPSYIIIKYFGISLRVYYITKAVSCAHSSVNEMLFLCATSPHQPHALIANPRCLASCICSVLTLNI